LSAFDETLATTTAVDFSISASLLSWFLPLIASRFLFSFLFFFSFSQIRPFMDPCLPLPAALK
jgi:hypothetical protein